MFSTTIYSDVFPLAANTQHAWQILTNFNDYPKWNPFTHKVVGSPVIGSTVDLHVNLVGDKTRISQEVVQIVEIERQISWGMTLLHPFLLKARRDQILTVIDEQHCSYHTLDELSGLLSPLVVLLFGNAMRNGFNRVGKALQQYCLHPL